MLYIDYTNKQLMPPDRKMSKNDFIKWYFDTQKNVIKANEENKYLMAVKNG